MRRFFQKVVKADSLLVLKRTKPKDKDKEKDKKPKNKDKEKKKHKDKPKDKDVAVTTPIIIVDDQKKDKTDDETLKSSSRNKSLQFPLPSWKIKNPNLWTPEDVVEWLKDLGLGEYEPIFLSNSIRGCDLPELEDEDLISINLIKVGHRKKLLNRISLLYQNIEGARTPNSLSHNAFSSAVILPTSNLSADPSLKSNQSTSAVFCEPYLTLGSENLPYSPAVFDCLYLHDKPISQDNLPKGETFRLTLRPSELTVSSLLQRIAQKLNLENDFRGNLSGTNSPEKKRNFGWELKYLDLDDDLVTLQSDQNLVLATKRAGDVPVRLYIACRDLPPGVEISDSSSSTSSASDTSSDDGESSDDVSEETSQ